MQEQTLIATLAALLHDLGKFWQRTGRPGPHYEASAAFVDEFEHLFLYAWQDDIRDGAGNHHRLARKEVEKIVKVADWLASTERETSPTISQSDPDKTPLLPVAALVEFRDTKPDNWQQWGYCLNALRLEEKTIFPNIEASVSPADYQRLWEGFSKELKHLSTVSDYCGLISFLAVLRKYASFIPSATPWEADEEYRTLPDISLYDHLKVTAAIAACLTRLYPNHLEALYQRDAGIQQQPVALLLRGDFSGIQNFLYRITRAEPTAEFRNTAKRLRGRSFYLTLLADVTADWLVRELGLSPANILFCGGGRFDLLIGADDTTKQNLEKLERRLQDWLLREFYGELGIQLATAEVRPDDFQDLGRVFNTLDDQLARKKLQKFSHMLDTDGFFIGEQLYHVCNYCRVTPLPDSDAEPCCSCLIQRNIGSKLPRTEYLAYVYGNGENLALPSDGLIDFAEPFGVKVALLKEDEAEQIVRRAGNRGERVVLYRLNNTDFLHDGRPGNIVCSFKFLGNAAPFAKQRIDPNPVGRGKDAIGPDEVLDFDEVAFMSSGAQLLGVLKADVDYLGQVFGLGVQPKSISRIATLSSAFDLFFAGWINRICQQLAESWHRDAQNDNPLKGKVEGLFYIVYSGGDDLLILGPWDAVIDLAQMLYGQFREFTCYNENLTLSAGILLVKPHFPIQRFAQLVGKQLEQSKNAGEYEDRPGLNSKDRITLFRDTVKWQENNKGFEFLLEFGKKLVELVHRDKLPRSFVYFLLRLHEQHFLKEETQNLMWVPKFRYALARRVSREVIADKELNLEDNIVRSMPHIRIPASYVGLKIRGE